MSLNLVPDGLHLSLSVLLLLILVFNLLLDVLSHVLHLLDNGQTNILLIDVSLNLILLTLQVVHQRLTLLVQRLINHHGAHSALGQSILNHLQEVIPVDLRV